MGKLNQNGFTLLETLVAVIVLSISIVSIMQLFSANLKALPASERHSKAVFHARAKMEEILLSDVVVVGINSGSFDDIFSWTVSIIKEDPPVKEAESDTSDQKIDTAIFNLFRIDLKILWNNGDKKKSYVVSTLTSQLK